MSEPLYDARLVFDPVEMEADLFIESGDLGPERTLGTSVMLSLFTDARAEANDPLPDGETNRRGYWADAYAETDGDTFGSKLWLLSREKSIATVAAKAKRYAEEALAWMIADGVAQEVRVTAELLPIAAGQTTKPVLALGVEILKPPDRVLAYRFRYVWES